jgi:protein TonB
MTAKDALHIPWAFSLTEAPRLPLTGEAHPLRLERARWMLLACLVTLALSGALFGGWLWWSSREPPPPPARAVHIVRYTELGVPPSIARPAVPQINVAEAVAQAVAPPSIGVPEPVPDAQAHAPTIATVQQMAEALNPIPLEALGSGTGDSLVIQIDVQPEPAPDDFVPVEEDPVRIHIDPPVYPEVARESGVEGTVMVRALVGKDGKVKRCVIVDGNPLLNDAAVTCAKTAVFRPALLDNRPVEVWVLIPVTFKIHR